MRGAPNFKQWPDAVDGKWKWELLRWLRYETGVDILVETGTCEGVTPYNLHNDFKEIHTIELHQGLYENAHERLRDFPNVFQYLGSSKEALEKVLLWHVPAGPVMFWLDAHSSGPHTADDGDPLPFELKTIMRLRPDALIVIDDMHCVDFCEPDPVTGKTYIESNGLDFSGWKREFRTGELIIYKEGRYKIPEFEQ
jgi:hypothetical protein